MTADNTSKEDGAEGGENAERSRLAIGKPLVPISVTFPFIIFSLSLFVSAVVSYAFYMDGRRFYKSMEVKELQRESELVEPLIAELYRIVGRDVEYLAHSPGVNQVLSVEGIPFEEAGERDVSPLAEMERNNRITRRMLENSLLQIMENSAAYRAIEVTYAASEWPILARVERQGGSVNIVGEAGNVKLKGGREEAYLNFLQEIATPYSQPSDATGAMKEVHFSEAYRAEIQGQDESSKRILAVAKPLLMQDGTFFGVLSIELDFEMYVAEVVDRHLKGVDFYLLKSSGEQIYPNLLRASQKTASIKLNVASEQMRARFDFTSPEKAEIQYANERPYLRRSLDFSEIGIVKPMHMIIAPEKDIGKQAFTRYRNRSLGVGLGLALLGLFLAVITSRRWVKPITQIANAVQSPSHQEIISRLPVEQRNELGGLARSFHNLLLSVEDSLKTQKTYAESAKKSSDLLHGILNTAADGIVTVDQRGLIRSFNQMATEMFGYAEEDVIGKSINILMPESFAKSHDEHIGRFISAGRDRSINVGSELFAVDKHGREFPIQLSISKIETADGYILTGIVRDISAEKKANNDLQRSVSVARAILESSDNGILVTSENREVLFVNSNFLNMWKVENFESATWPTMNEVSKHVRKFMQDPLYFDVCVSKADDRSTVEFFDILALNDKRVVELSFRPVTLQDEYVGRAWSFRDISLTKETERLLVNAKIAAESAAHFKSDFLASMSHELRTPMNGVLGMLELLERTDQNDKQRHFTKLAILSADALRQLINDILDFSKMEAGKLHLLNEDLHLADLIGDTCKTLALAAEKKKLNFTLDCRGIDVSHVRGDAKCLQQILTNLLSNAIKFTEKGDVVVSVELSEVLEGEKGNSYHRLVLNVIDTGIGVALDDQKNLFSSFTQVDGSHSRHQGGTGLGLAIVKKLCQQMHGDVSVESELGKGSRFRVAVNVDESSEAVALGPNYFSRPSSQEVPHSATAAHKAANIDASMAPRILVLDSDKTRAHVITTQLEKWKCQVSHLSHSEDVMALFGGDTREFGSMVYDLVLVDSDLKSIGGLALGEQLKTIMCLDNSRMVIIDSASQPRERQQLEMAGFNHGITKPVSVKDLIGVLEHCDKTVKPLAKAPAKQNEEGRKSPESSLVNFAPEPVKAAVKPQGSSVRERILIAEDNEVNQSVVEGLLEDFNYQLDFAENGRLAIEFLKDSAYEEKFSLILMDCQMPDIDGYEATQRIRQGLAGKQYRGIPIIALTANVMAGDREKCLQAGMNAYISKPIDSEELIRVIHLCLPGITPDTVLEASQYLEGQGGDRLAETGGGVIEPRSSEEPSKTSGDDANLVWNKESALKRVRGKEERLLHLVNVFLDDMPTRVESLNHLLNNEDYESSALLAHMIKGVAGNLSAMQLSTFAADIETISKTGRVDDVPELLREFNSSYSHLQKCLKQYISDFQAP